MSLVQQEVLMDSGWIQSLKAFASQREKSEPQGISALRRRALDTFETKGLPTRKWEAWRYTNLLPLLQTDYRPVGPNDELIREEEKLLEKHRDRLNIVFKNGAWLLGEGAVPAVDGVSFSSLANYSALDIEDAARSSLEQEENPFALMNAFASSDSLLVRVKKEASLNRPLQFWFFLNPEKGQASLSLPRLLLLLEPGARAEVVCRWIVKGESSSLMNAVIETRLGAEAGIDMTHMQQVEGTNRLFVTSRTQLNEASRMEGVTFSRGGSMIRNDTAVDFNGKNAFCSLNGLALLSGESQVFNEIKMNHRTPLCTSRQFYKSILDESSLTEYNSLVYVLRDAQKSDTGQLNKNLLLSDDARAVSRPQLKIYADDVSANHGSASGQAAGQELFYLQSRGLNEKLARFVLTYGFAEEILQQIKILEVRRELEAYVHHALEYEMKSIPR